MKDRRISWNFFGQPKPWVVLGIHKSTWYRRDKQSVVPAKIGRPVIYEIKPWVVLGIHKSTWYKRRKSELKEEPCKKMWGVNKPIVAVAVYQSERKQNADTERARAEWENYYASIGEWSPADELPDPDEVQSQDD